MKLGKPLQHIMLERRTKFHPHPTTNMCAGCVLNVFFFLCMWGNCLEKKCILPESRTCLVFNGDETWYASPTHHIGEAYQASPLSDTTHIRRRVLNVFFSMQGIAQWKSAFQLSPRTCLVSDGDETWYASTTHHFGEVYKVSSPSNTEHVHKRVLNVFFLCPCRNCLEKNRISIEPTHMFSFGWGWNLVRLSNTSCWRGVPSFSPIQHYTYARARAKCVSFYMHRRELLLICWLDLHEKNRCWMDSSSLLHLLQRTPLFPIWDALMLVQMPLWRINQRRQAFLGWMYWLHRHLNLNIHCFLSRRTPHLSFNLTCIGGLLRILGMGRRGWPEFHMIPLRWKVAFTPIFQLFSAS